MMMMMTAATLLMMTSTCLLDNVVVVDAWQQQPTLPVKKLQQQMHGGLVAAPSGGGGGGGPTMTTTARQYAVEMEIVAASATLTKPQRTRRVMLSKQQRQQQRLKTVTQIQLSPTALAKQNKSHNESRNDNNNYNNKGPHNDLLSKEEEVMYSYRLRTLRTAIRIRDELVIQQKEARGIISGSGSNNNNKTNKYTNEQQQQPLIVSDAAWAAACGTTPRELRRWLEEGREAREILVAANVGLVTSVAQKHYRKLQAASRGATILTLQDMMQEGNLGLLKAAERFEPERGFRFSTYATYWIRQRISRSINDSSRVIRLPAHVHGTLNRLHRLRAQFQTSEGRNPSTKELAAALDISTHKLQKLTDAAQAVLSLQTPLKASADDTRTLADKVASAAPSPEEECQTATLKADVRTALRTCLTDTEQAVVTHRFGLEGGKPASIAATGRALQLTPESVRLTEARALNKLRQNLGVAALQDYVGDGSGNSASESSRRSSAKKATPGARVTKKKIWESAAWHPVGNARAPSTSTRAASHGGTRQRQDYQSDDHGDSRSDRLWFF